MYYLDPRVYDSLPAGRRRAPLAAFLNLVASQAHETGEALAPQRWYAARLGTTVRTVKRLEAELRRLGLLVMRHGLAWNRRAIAIASGLVARLAPKVARQWGHGGHHRGDRRVPTVGARNRGTRVGAEEKNSPKASSPSGGSGSGPAPEWDRVRAWSRATLAWLQGRGPQPTAALLAAGA